MEYEEATGTIIATKQSKELKLDVIRCFLITELKLITLAITDYHEQMYKRMCIIYMH